MAAEYGIYDTVVRLQGDPSLEALRLSVVGFELPVLEYLHGPGSVARIEKRAARFVVEDEEGVVEALVVRYGEKAVSDVYPGGRLDADHPVIRRLDDLAERRERPVFAKKVDGKMPTFLPFPGKVTVEGGRRAKSA